MTTTRLLIVYWGAADVGNGDFADDLAYRFAMQGKRYVVTV